MKSIWTLGCLILFDKGDMATFNDVSKWYQECRTSSHRSATIGIVGIKSDQETVTTEKGKQLTDELNGIYFETTSTDKEKIIQILSEL